MPEDIKVTILGKSVSINELRKDVIESKQRTASNQWAFTPEVVEALLNKIEELGKEILTLRSVISRG